MPVTPSSTVIGVFRNRSAADQAVEALYNAGFERGQMRYIASNTSGGFFEDLKSFFTGSSANTSHAEGDTSNPLAALGLARETAQYYSDEYNKGNPVLVVNALEQGQEALDILKHYGSYNAQINSTDDVQPLTNSPQANSYETLTPQSNSNAQSWELRSQPLTAQEEDHQQDTEPFSVIRSSPFAPPSYDPSLYHTQTNESVSDNPVYSPAAPFFENSAVFDTPQPDISTADQEEETPTSQANGDIHESEVDDEETPASQADGITPEHETNEVDEVETPAYQADMSASEQKIDEIDQEEILAYQADMATPENEADGVDDEETPTSQASGYTSEYIVDESEKPTAHTDMDTYSSSQTAADVLAHATDIQSLSQTTTAAEHAEKLQQIQDQIKLTQQQLQDAKAKLEATKERENQYRKRQKQLQNSRKQLQELQEELQATQAELQETEARVASYQYPGMENYPKKSDKSKKSKVKDFKYI